ncbi:hypothetical protein EsDP_00002456 [Epichloe bromicola]|uniref:PH domain-containing protein n=1 Tax=Epichloe bromicola TaxID=79588 RepID=A0ABQ0CKU8_9HYPO
MDSLDGHLQVPPDRSQILGRQSWKTRYINVGSRQTAARDRQGSQAFSLNPSNRASSVILKSVNKNATNDLYLSVFKSKDDWEPIQQWLLSHVSDCQVQLLSHRKQGPVLPTLVVTISNNQRRRRSTRATGFISSNKDSGVTTLWFRTPPDDHRPSLDEWARFIMAKKGSASTVESPVSPVFTSPFQTRNHHDSPDLLPRPGSGNRGLQHKSSTATYSTGPLDRPATFSSESPSLRSKRSDISSPSSNNHPTQKIPYSIPEQHYTAILPGDIVTPGRDGEYQGQFIEGWTSAQGRSSTMSSPVRGRDSIGSQSQLLSPIVDVASPPAPGETILDRAFQLGQIPGAGSYIPGQEKLSSIARFDALMRESDGKRRKRETIRKGQQGVIRSAFDDDDSSDDGEGEEDEESDDSDDSDDSDSESDAYSPDQNQSDAHSAPLMSPSAQRALAYITCGGRNESDRNSKKHRPSVSRTHLSFHAGMAPPSKLAPPSRPHTAHAKSRPNASRAQSTPHLMPTAATSLDLPSSGRAQDEPHHVTTTGKRHSNSSAKRLSLTGLTKAFSSTSSLLLVQTNASAGSSHISSEADIQNSTSAPRANLSLRGSGPPPRPKELDDQERRCRWRNSVGIVAAEGGFL